MREREREEFEAFLKKMETPEGMRQVIADYGEGHAKCRTCGTVVDIAREMPNAKIEKVQARTAGSHLVAPQLVDAFKISVQCPKGDNTISFGTFRRGIGLDQVNSGDRYSKQGYYLSCLADLYRQIGKNLGKMREVGLNPDGSPIPGWEPPER